MPEQGDIIDGKYRLDQLLGQGGMGSVFEAEHLQIAKKIAVKFLKTELSEQTEYTQRFIREARAASATGHKSIVDIHDIGQTPEGDLYLVMELLEGESLAALIDRQPMLGVTQATYIAAHVLSALAAAHEHGIVHRDVKPENVFLEYTGQTWPEIKLLDFGASKFAEGGGSQAGRLTATGIVLGTPYYMSPEQARGELDVDHRADIYGVGVLLYEMLTGELPFHGANYNAVMSNVLTGPFELPRTHSPTLPEDLERVVLAAMTRERSQRYESAAMMLQDLLPFVEEKAVATIALPRGVTLTNSTYPGVESSLDISRPISADASGRIDVSRDALTTTVHRGVPLWAIVTATAFLVGILAVGVTLLFVWLGNDDEVAVGPRPDTLPAKTLPVPPVPHIENAILTPGPDSAGSTKGPVDGGTDHEGDQVEITLADLPPGAAVFVDGHQVDGPVLQIPRGSVEVQLRVELEGHRPWQRTLDSPIQVETISVVLERGGGADAGYGELAKSKNGSRRDRPRKRDRPRNTKKQGQGPLKRNPFDF